MASLDGRHSGLVPANRIQITKKVPGECSLNLLRLNHILGATLKKIVLEET